MRGLGALGIAFVIAGCSAPPSSLAPASTAVPEPSTSSPETGEASSQPRAEGYVDLLDCEGPVSQMGGLADDFGPEGAGATPDEAFTSWLATTMFGMPRDGWAKLGDDGARHIYAYAMNGKNKVVVVISSRFGEFVGGAFTIEELRTCDPSEYGPLVDLGPNRRVWAHDETGEILTDIAGPAHCGWQTARMLHISDAQGILARQYLRDPDGVFADIPSVPDTYAEGIELPPNASFSGYRTADGLELWFTATDEAAYVVTPDGVERWPRAEEPIGCS